MLRSSRSALLTLSLALPVAALGPAISWALGLGDIHVSSALGQPLEAQIELFGANPGDTATLNAQIPDEDQFRQHGLERPSFLSGATLAVGTDDRGRPVLLVHSTERVTEPIVTLLVGVHSPDGQLIREYTVLLDPPDQAPPPRALKPGPNTASEAKPPVSTQPVRARTPQVRTYTVAAHDTLERIARIAGARSRSELRRMAIAIYHANPEAFRANLNLLRRGATVHLPTAEQLSAISARDADREYFAQTRAWQAAAHHIAPAAAQPLTASAQPVPAAAPTGTESDEVQVRLLTERVRLLAEQVRLLTEQSRSLQRSLDQMQQELSRPLVRAATTPVRAGSAAVSAAARDPSASLERRAAGMPASVRFAAPAVCLGLVCAAGLWYRRRRQIAKTPSMEAPPDAQSAPLELRTEQSKVDEPAPSPPTTLLSAPPAAREHGAETEPAAEPVSPPSEATSFNQVFRSATDNHLSTTLENTTHVVMSSGLNEPRAFVERRKNPADVLRQAIEREPHRSDLRLKLLELYYRGASQSRRAFIEAVQQLAKQEGLVTPEDWSRIVDMGRAIAPDDELFSEGKGSKAVA
jgi:pilus assembly protein FimV